MSNSTTALSRWKEHVPADLIPAVTFIRDQFGEVNWNCRETTQTCCYALLHPEQTQKAQEAKRYTVALNQLKACIGAPAQQYFHLLLRERTPAATLAAFFFLYQKGLDVQVRASFTQLLAIALANVRRIEMQPIHWAAWHVESMVDVASRTIGSWLKRCCDVQPHDPKDDSDEIVLWKKWRAPSFIRMKPCLSNIPWDEARSWEREDIETSLRIAERFTEDFVGHLEGVLKESEGKAAVDLASQSSAQITPVRDATPATTQNLRRAPSAKSVRTQKAIKELAELWNKYPNLSQSEMVTLADREKVTLPWPDCSTWDDALVRQHRALKTLLSKARTGTNQSNNSFNHGTRKLR